MRKLLLITLLNLTIASKYCEATNFNTPIKVYSKKNCIPSYKNSFKFDDTLLNCLLNKAFCCNVDLLILREQNKCQSSCSSKYLSYQEEVLAWQNISFELITTYVNLRLNQQKAQFLEKNIENQEKIISLTQDLIQRGSSDAITLAMAKAKLNVLQAQKIDIKKDVENNIHHISTLLGLCPNSLRALLVNPSDLPQLINCEIIDENKLCINQRADIKKAEYINCLDSSCLNKLDLKKTYLSAYNEVYDAQNTLEKNKIKSQLIKQSFYESLEAFNLISDLHKRGLKDTFELIDAQDKMIETQITYIETKAQLLINQIILFHGMGKNVYFFAN
jgi:outer membrane protein TolC